MKSTPFFSETAPPDSTADDANPRATPTAHAPLKDSRHDFNVVFIHSRLDDYGLPPAEFRVYAHIARRASSGEAFPAVKSIARICRLNPKTIRRALRVLVRHALLRREDRPGQTAVYRLTSANEWQPPTNINTPPCQTDTPVPDGKPTLPKRIQAHPTQKDTAEGNPSEGNPRKEGIHTPGAGGLPLNEVDAVEQAKLVGVPPEFARVEFCRLDSVGWVNGAGNPVHKWTSHLRKRWADDQSQRAERAARGNSRSSRGGGFVPPRTFDAENYHQPVDKF